MARYNSQIPATQLFSEEVGHLGVCHLDSNSQINFILSKYSRSYPMKRPTQKNQQTGPEFSSDWQHFTNPIIRLVLDAKTGSDAEIESVKLRILWEDINNGIESSANPQMVVFEDLDLLSFSTLTSGPQRKNQSEGLPLKAVYRDTVVGIRYLHSREEGSSMPIYRRFQISFQIPSEASDFIRAIKPICPCKLNPTSIPGPALSQMHTLPIRPVRQSTLTVNPALQSRTTSYACPPPSVPSMHQGTASVFPQQKPSSPLTIQPSSDLSSFVAVENHRLVTEPSSGTSIGHIQATSGTSECGLNLNPQHNDLRHSSRTNTIPVITHNLPASSLPNSSLPSSSNSAVMGSLPVQGHSSEPTRPSQTIHPILNAFEESISIYNLPNSEVERILSEVLHEEGFVQLVERVSGMLMVQTLLDS